MENTFDVLLKFIQQFNSGIIISEVGGGKSTRQQFCKMSLLTFN